MHSRTLPHDVSSDNQPKSRSPRTRRDKLPYRHSLPRCFGPYSVRMISGSSGHWLTVLQVGIMDIEIPARSPRPFSHRNGHYSLQLETVLVSLYYPSTFGSGTGRDACGQISRSRGIWLPGPRAEMAKGYGKFAGIPQWASMLFFLSTTWFTKIPAYRNAHVAAHWPPRSNSKCAEDKIKDEEAGLPDRQSERPVFPRMVFSHGLGGSRTAYSSLCGEFASYGFIVCAIEHRDGSGARTFVNHPPKYLNSYEKGGMKGEVDRSAEQKHRNYDVVDFIYPKDNPYDTRPGNSNGVDEELRTQQLKLRQAKVEEAFEIIRAINDGRGADVAVANLRKAGAIGASSRGLDGVDWTSWKGRIDIYQGTMLGHSFGAATTVEILRHSDRFSWVKQGISYDIWSAPVKPASDFENRITAPILGIKSEAFMYWKENLDAAQSLCREAERTGALSWLMTIRGTVHMAQSDFCLLYPHLAALFLKQTLKPQRAIDLNVNASLEFLSLVMPQPLAPFHRSLQNEKLLELACIFEVPTEHRPKEKYVASRLKRSHNYRWRFLPKLWRRLKPTDGVVSDNPEVWMHIAPTEDALQKWHRGRGPAVHEATRKASIASEKASTCPAVLANGHGTEINPPYKGFVSSSTPVWPATNSGNTIPRS